MTSLQKANDVLPLYYSFFGMRDIFRKKEGLKFDDIFLLTEWLKRNF